MIRPSMTTSTRYAIKGFLKENPVEVALLGKQKGTALLISFIIMGVLMLLGLYFLSFTLTESRIARSQTVGTQAYYLAEAGINIAIWKLKYDDTWSTCFVASTSDCRSDCNATWTATFVENTDSLIPNSTTTVSILSPICARGVVTATSTLALPGGKTAQRVVKTTVRKALGSLTKDSAIFGNGNVETSFSRLNIHNGNIWSNGNITLSNSSVVNIYDDSTTGVQEGQALATGNITLSGKSSLNSSSSCAKNTCTELCEGYETGTTSCPPEKVDIPMIDFDSEATSSYKNRASSKEESGGCQVFCKKADQATTTCSTQCVFTQDEFENLLWQIGKEGTLTLGSNSVPTITYVTGNINLRGARYLVVNGVLVAEGNISLGESGSWKGDHGPSQVTVNDPGPDIPSGILAIGNIKFGKYSSLTDLRINGLIYTLGNFELANLPNLCEIYGGQIAAGNFSLTGISQELNIYLDNAIIREGIWGGPKPPGEEKPPYSPVVTIEHWEETY